MHKIKLSWKFILVILLLNGLISTLTLYAAGSWLLKINGEEVLSIDSFEKDFDAYIDFQSLSQPLISKSEIKKNKDSKKNKKLYLQTLINDLLMIKDAKKQGIYDKNKVAKKVKIISKIFERQFIKQLYIRKVIIPKAKRPADAVIKHFYNKLNTNKQTKNWSASKKKEMAEKQAKFQEIQRAYLFTIDNLRSKNRIKTNEDYEDSLER